MEKKFKSDILRKNVIQSVKINYAYIHTYIHIHTHMCVYDK